MPSVPRAGWAANVSSHPGQRRRYAEQDLSALAMGHRRGGTRFPPAAERRSPPPRRRATVRAPNRRVDRFGGSVSTDLTDSASSLFAKARTSVLSHRHRSRPARSQPLRSARGSLQAEPGMLRSIACTVKSILFGCDRYAAGGRCATDGLGRPLASGDSSPQAPPASGRPAVRHRASEHALYGRVFGTVSGMGRTPSARALARMHSIPREGVAGEPPGSPQVAPARPAPAPTDPAQPHVHAPNPATPQ